MTVTDITASWIATLDAYDRVGPALSPEVAAGAPRPANPTPSEWAALHDAFALLHRTVTELARSGRATVPHTSLHPGSDRTVTYVKFNGDIRLNGRLYLLEATPDAPFTAHLRRFVAFVPAAYHRTGDQGHYVWAYYPPFWNGGRDPQRFTAAHRDYPNGFWQHKFVMDYLQFHQLHSSFIRAGLNAIMILPVHRFTVGNSTAPMAGAAALVRVLTPLLQCLEGSDPRLRGHSGGGTVAGLGVGCFSAGASHASHVFAPGQRLSDLLLVRGVAFIDGVPNDGRQSMRAMVGSSSVRGWLDLPAPRGVLRHAAMFEQSNPGPRDMVGAAQELLPGPFRRIRRGRTEFVPGRNLPAFNELAFHWADTTAMGAASGDHNPDPSHPFTFWHGLVSRYFMEPAMAFLRHSFAM